MTAPFAKKLSAVSPSRYQALKDCFLQVAFSQASERDGERSDAQMVGEAAHEALEWVVKGGAPFEVRQSKVGDYFMERLDVYAQGREVAGARPARARIRKVAARTVALVHAAGGAANVRTERRLEGRQGRLIGILDLAIASPVVHTIVDYKTGPAVDEEGELAQHIQEQLAIYCLLEHEATGDWPGQAFVFGFHASPIEWTVDPSICEDVGTAALELCDEYERYRGSPPPASPAPSACRFCSFAPRCDAFWTALDQEWSDSLQAVRGRVRWGKQTPAGEFTLSLADCEGTETGDVVVQEVPARLLPNGETEEGDTIALVGLWKDRQGRLKAARSLRTSSLAR